jgi:mediator of RNA polymerase II transcription subunit 12
MEFPLTGLSDQDYNLRRMLLRGTPYSAEIEQHALHLAQHSISQALPALFGLDSTATDLAELNVAGLSPTVRLELGMWLRQWVAGYADVNEQ